MGRIRAVRVGPDFELVLSRRVDNCGASGLELLAHSINDGADERCEEGEDEESEGFGDFVDKSFQPRDHFNSLCEEFDDFVTKFEDWIDLLGGLDRVKIWTHTRNARTRWAASRSWRSLKDWIRCAREVSGVDDLFLGGGASSQLLGFLAK